MMRGLYSAATALDTAIANQEIVADNLANASTPGYRRQGLIFSALQEQAVNPQAAPSNATNAGPASRNRLNPAPSANSTTPAVGTQAAGQYTSFDSGPLQYTGNPFDLALTGDAFFALDGPNGPVYTRNGSFQLDAQGQLRNASGMAVRGQGGRITIPQGASRFVVGRDGTVYADDLAVGQLDIVQFPEPNNVLRRVGTTLFAGAAPSGRAQASTYGVEQGYREGSNVQVVNEMVSMITGMRFYEAAERAMRTLGEAVAMNTRPQ